MFAFIIIIYFKMKIDASIKGREEDEK
jgi:hypothetical protein